MDQAYGPIGFFSVAYGQLIIILELYRAIGGLPFFQASPANRSYVELGGSYYLVLGCMVGVAAAFAGINFMLSDASLEAQRALKSLVEPLEIGRTKLEFEEVVSSLFKNLKAVL